MDFDQIKKFNSFDELLSSGFFNSLTENQQIEAYWFFEKGSGEDTFAVYSYKDLDVDFQNQDLEDLRIEERSPLDFVGYHLIGCFDGDSVVGFSATLNEGSHIYLGGLAVVPEYRGRGIMGGLINCLQEGLPITCKVERSNDVAINAFSKYGFFELSRNSRYVDLVRDISFS